MFFCNASPANVHLTEHRKAFILLFKDTQPRASVFLNSNEPKISTPRTISCGKEPNILFCSLLSSLSLNFAKKTKFMLKAAKMADQMFPRRLGLKDSSLSIVSTRPFEFSQKYSSVSISRSGPSRKVSDKRPLVNYGLIKLN